MVNKEEQYTALYFPESMLEEKEQTYWGLLDIDCNFSRLIQALLSQIKEKASLIKAAGKNFRHFEWKLVIVDKRTGEELK